MILESPERIAEYTDRGWWGDKTLADLFLENVRRTPEAVAVVDPPNRAALTPGEPQRLTYGELKTAADRLAKALLDAGAGRDDVVMVQLPNIVELVVVYLAAARIGAILTPLPVQFRTYELRHAIELTEPKVFITTSSFGDHDHVAMIRGLQPEFPAVQHVLALRRRAPAGGLVAHRDPDHRDRHERGGRLCRRAPRLRQRRVHYLLDLRDGRRAQGGPAQPQPLDRHRLGDSRRRRDPGGRHACSTPSRS